MHRDSKSQLVATRVTPREKALILATATAEGCSVSQLLSEAISNTVRAKLSRQFGEPEQVEADVDQAR